MNQTKCKVLSLFAACSAALVMGMAVTCACSGPQNDPTPKSISIGGEFQARYIIGEELDVSGMVVTADFSDGTSRILLPEEYTVTPGGKLYKNNNSVTVSYNGVQATRKIAVGNNLQDENESTIKTTFEKHTFTDGTNSIPYRLRKPDNDDVASPLVLFMHGAGERGTDNEAQLLNAICKMFLSFKCPIYDATVIAPQCPEQSQWVNWPWENGNYSTESIAESTELSLVYKIVQEYAEKPETDPSRIYVVGLSMGGFGTWDLLARHGDMFAAGVPICGGGDPACAPALAQIPIFTFHGDADTTVPVDGTRAMVNEINAQNKGLLHYVEFAGDGHNIWDKAVTFKGDSQNPALLDWLFKQKKG